MQCFWLARAGLRLSTTSVPDVDLDSLGNSGTFANTTGMDCAD